MTTSTSTTIDTTISRATGQEGLETTWHEMAAEVFADGETIELRFGGEVYAMDLMPVLKVAVDSL